jgi:hypothetical protein
VCEQVPKVQSYEDGKLCSDLSESNDSVDNGQDIGTPNVIRPGLRKHNVRPYPLSEHPIGLDLFFKF